MLIFEITEEAFEAVLVEDVNLKGDDLLLGIELLRVKYEYLKSVLSLKTVNKQLDVPVSALRLGYAGQSQYGIWYIQLFVYRL